MNNAMYSSDAIVPGDLVVLDISEDVFLWDDPDVSKASHLSQKFRPTDLGLVLVIQDKKVEGNNNFYLLTSTGTAGWVFSSFFRKCRV
jgi:hypothetical protein